MAVIKVILKEELCFDGSELAKKRDEAGLTQADFSRKAGWSQPYQAKLEKPGKHCVSREKYLTIEQIFAENSVLK